MSDCPLSQRPAHIGPVEEAGFVAINTIHCENHYRERFECLFCSRAKMIDTMPGFIGMSVLKDEDPTGAYLVISYWKSKECFDAWVGSPEFYEGHKRAFADLKAAKQRGEQSPMKSEFRTYDILTH